MLGYQQKALLQICIGVCVVKKNRSCLFSPKKLHSDFENNRDTVCTRYVCFQNFLCYEMTRGRVKIKWGHVLVPRLCVFSKIIVQDDQLKGIVLTLLCPLS